MVDRNGGKSEGSSNRKTGKISGVWTIFMHADATDKWLMAVGLLSSLASSFGIPAMLLISSKVMNNVGSGLPATSQYTRRINENVRIFICLGCARLIAGFLEGYCWTRTGERQASRMRIQYLKAVLRQDIEYFDLEGATTADVITSVSSDSLVIQDVLSEKMTDFISNCGTLFGCFIVACVLEWRIALVTTPTGLFLIIPGFMYGRVLIGLARKMRAEYSKAGEIVEQAVSSVRTVYAFVGEGKAIQEFSAAMEGSVKLGLRQGLVMGIALGSHAVTYAIWALVTWYGGRMVVNHGVKGGTVFAIGASIMAGGLAFGKGLSNLKYISEAISAGERVMEIMRRKPMIDSESSKGGILKSVMGEVEFKGVEFAYPSRPENLILKGLNLSVSAGKTVALVGGSGSGKSTIIAMLERFYDPKAGQILLDGVDIRELHLKWLRSQMGLVSQEPMLFATSIKANILLGKEDALMDEVVAAAKDANAHNFISQLPAGYETQVGERGVQMSGGQKQRIAIARAILKSPKILLLDEATSALDSESERIVQEALDSAAVGRTTIVIAHRLSTIQSADIIAVVEAGQIVETGSHDELMGMENSIYSSLVRLQQNAPVKEDQRACLPSIQTTDMSLLSSRENGNDHVNDFSKRFSLASRSNSTRSISSASGAVLDAPESGEPRPKLQVPSFRRLLMLNAPEWKQALVGCLCAVVIGTLLPFYAYSNGSLISIYFSEDHSEIKHKTKIYALIFTSIFIISLFVNIAQYYSFGVMGEYLTKRVRVQMLSKILTFEVGWFDQDENSSGAICSQMDKDAAVVRSLVGDRMALIIQTFSTVAVAGIISLIISWRLAIVMIGMQPIVILCFYTRRVLHRSMSSKASKAQAESSKLASEAVSNVRTITAFSSQDHVIGLFILTQEGPLHENIRQSWIAGIVLGLSICLMTFTWALTFWYGGKLISLGYLTSKGLFQNFLILLTTGVTIANAGSMTTDLAKGADSVSYVFSVLDKITKIEPDDPDGHCPEKLIGSIEICNVNFAYPTRPDVLIFKGFSLDISAGKSTALVGHSGSGKSTIIGLIERFYDPSHGVVKIDGIDIKSFHLRSLRRHIALVGQEPTLFSGSIRENIAYGARGETVTQSEIEDAARAAHAHNFITALQDGYDTWCGDRGVQLSGGQKQRIAIARAILRDPAVLLLDEATSALDSHSEKVVQEALERLMMGRTSVVVAHRLSTIQNCDMIAVLEKGSVVEKGTHSSLLANGPGGAYYGLVRLQQVHQEDQNKIA